ncbi:hypothetical protein EKH80_04945 [Dyella choica]|uniref:Nucleotidyltransferase family protein n=2 Tax=Dyella choica TaxID=1927959 RepID=A0A432M943_9GAMM|nr:hypothetical protein EKH80_04945 [Dyella choica]
MMHPGQALREAIATSVPLLRSHCRDPWVVIGSAACALAGAAVEVADLDLLTSAADAQQLTALWSSRLDGSYTPAGADRFRSHFARFRFPGLPLEVMGGLELNQAGDWLPVQVNEIVHVDVAGIAVPIPSRVEQIRLLKSFGRPKDRARAELLRAV